MTFSQSGPDVAESIPDGYLSLDRQWHITFWNKQAAGITGRYPSELLGAVIWHMFPDFLGTDVEQHAREVMANLEKATFEYECTQLGKWLHVHMVPRHDGLDIFFRDITASHNHADPMPAAIANGAADETADGIFLISPELKIVHVNARGAAMTGYTASELHLRPIADIVDTEDLQRDPLDIDQYKPGVERLIRRRIRRKNGTYVWVESHGILRSDGNIHAIIRDISSREDTDAKLQWQANHDTLTGLPNRTLFQERLKQVTTIAERQGERAAILFIDLDGFKSINDQFGHQTGDVLLSQVGERLQGCLRSEDTVARNGGDEFTVLLPGIKNPDYAAIVAQKILVELQNPFLLEHHLVEVNASIGISIYPDDAVAPDDLIARADRAMYQSKEIGPGNYRMALDGMNDSAVNRMKLEHSVQSALAHNAFTLAFNPVVALSSRQIKCVDVELRWKESVGSQFDALHSLTSADDSNLVLQLGDWLLRNTVQHLADWKKAGADVHVCLRITARQFYSDAAHQLLRVLLEQHNIDPRLIMVCIPETAFVSDAATVAMAMDALCDIGVPLCLDDFGAAWGALSQLTTLPFRYARVPYAQIALGNVVRETFARSVSATAKAAGRRIIIKGMPDTANWDWYMAAGYDLAQGVPSDGGLSKGSVQEAFFG